MKPSTFDCGDLSYIYENIGTYICDLLVIEHKHKIQLVRILFSGRYFSVIPFYLEPMVTLQILLWNRIHFFT